MALRRLARDLRSLEDSPLPGVAAIPLPQDLQTWHFNLQGPGGEFGGLVVHGILRVPPSYPNKPPQVRLCTPLPHPNVWSAVGEGFEVCMDMLDDGGAAAPYSGWSSSYCIASLLLQLQSALFDERAAVYDEVSAGSALRLAGAYACPCGHRPGCVKPPLPTEAQLEQLAKKVVAKPRLLGASSVPAAPRTALPSAATPAVSKEAAEESEWRAVRSRRAARQEAERQQQQVQSQACSGESQAVALDMAGAWGIRAQRAPAELTRTQLRNARRSRRRADQRSQAAQLADTGESFEEASTVASSAELVRELGPDVGTRRGVPAAIGRVPHRLLIEVLTLLAPEDAARFALCGPFFASLAEDGILWRNLFSQRYPSSALTAESMRDWKHCFLLEVNHIEADLVCFHTKMSFQEATLGVPLDFSVNPRTQRVDYISTTLDLLSAEAFDGGLRRSQWNEPIKEWLPLYLTAEHFERGRARFERAVVRLSPHWRSCRFHPHMALEVVPKLMNTMIVLLCDKGLEASDRALDGYFLLWRLLRAVVEVYALAGEVESRLHSFREPRHRTKDKVPSMGDFLPLLSVSASPARAWQALAQPVLEEVFDRSVLWACRDHPEFAAPKMNVLSSGADMARLQATLASTKVSKRLLMFHVKFLELVGGRSTDLFFGFPPQHTRAAFKAAVRRILAVERWPEFFDACGRTCPSPARLTDVLRQATKNSLRKGYHRADTDFRRIQASGVSHILKKGESYTVASGVGRVLLELGSDSHSILCGACLVYEDLSCAAVVSYDRRFGYRDAVKHSGDMQVEGKSKHVIEVDLQKLPAAVTRLYFTLCACGCEDLSRFKAPSINMRDPSSGAPLCTYSLQQAGRAPTVVMCVVMREPSGWRVKASGEASAVPCCGSYHQVKRDIAALRV
eukprot:CAMPEP_0176181130 /NCGR_PEP_ID=MMETSP0120_2-20121206/92809_1 /TAXON_ID=160619 /ORGANISM="Kryptoperidinium foliaceum, Strain CCMP 1326" /LENGTH=907 /DNA_ID=CAMNT_0017519351 /DNA_START=35 /DNA_END=2758 /DNA_ORIENTATION=-